MSKESGECNGIAADQCSSRLRTAAPLGSRRQPDLGPAMPSTYGTWLVRLIVQTLDTKQVWQSIIMVFIK